jgi:hypothetical protein
MDTNLSESRHSFELHWTDIADTGITSHRIVEAAALSQTLPERLMLQIPTAREANKGSGASTGTARCRRLKADF